MNRTPLPDFAQVDLGRVEPLRAWPLIALDTAQPQATPLELNLPGDLLWVTADASGVAHVRLNDRDAARLPVAAGTVLRGARYRRLFLDWAAQPGRALHLIYGAGVSVGLLPPPLAPATLGPSSYFRDSSDATLFTLVAPGANTAGILITILYLSSASSQLRIMTKPSAPTSWNDPAAVTLGVLAPGLQLSTALPIPLLLPAGYGLYEQASSVASATSVHAAFEVL